MHLSTSPARNLLALIVLAVCCLNPAAGQPELDRCPLECFNGGECFFEGHDTLQFMCECPTLADGTKLFTGIRCETPITTCTYLDVTLECFNGGTCNYKKSKCKCPPGFSGEHCEFGPVACINGSVCHNGGICWENAWTKEDRCVCPEGTSGTRCQRKNLSSGAKAGVTIAVFLGLGLVAAFIVVRRKRSGGGEDSGDEPSKGADELKLDEEVIT